MYLLGIIAYYRAMQNSQSIFLAELKEQNRYRTLNLPRGIDLTSNDYLGMATHPDLRALAVKALEGGLDIGAAGSRLLRGHTKEHAQLEEFAANYFGADRALYFANGFLANYALLTTLPNRHDIVLYDELVHASMRDGLTAGKYKSYKFAHNDMTALENLLMRHQDQYHHQNHGKSKQIWIAVESVYSMDGDKAPLHEIHDLAVKYNAMLIADEAHATGIYGKNGKGIAYDIIEQYGYNNLITIHTCGKAIGVAGGLICASAVIIDYMINKARPFIYSTAPMPLQALLVQKSLEILASDDGQERRNKLLKLCARAKELFGGAGSQIVPIIISDDKTAVNIASAIQGKGYDIRAIRPPTVPQGSARLRLSLSSNMDESVLQSFADALKPYMKG